MRSNIFSMKALRLALLSMFIASTIIGVNSCRDEFDEKEALDLEHAFLLQLQQQRDDARRQALLDSVQAAQAAAQQAATDERAKIQLQADLQAARDALFLKGGSINYAVNVVDGNSTTFSGSTSNNQRTSSEDMSGFVVSVFHQELGTLNNGTTDASGMVVFPDLRVGKVTVNVLKPGFTPVNYVADITPSSPFEKPTSVSGSPVGDANGYVRSAATVVPAFAIALGNVFDGTQSVPTAELNRYSTVSGKINVETDLTDFDREVAPAGTLVSLSIDSDNATFLNVINRASTAMTNTSGQDNEGDNTNDNAEGDGRIIQLTYSDATFTGVSNANGEYTVVVPSFPTGNGLPVKVQYSTFAADQKLYDVVSREVNNTNGDAVWGVVTKRAVFAAVAAGAQSTVPDFDAVDVSVASPVANVNGQGATAKAYIDDADGAITKVVMVNGGHNYYAAPWVVFKGGAQGALDGYTRQELVQSFEDPTSALWNDDVARGTATMENGVVTGVTITNPGAGYTKETIEVVFIPRGNAPTFTATISAGGGCIASGTSWTIAAGFTQVPTLTPSDARLAGKYTATVSGGTVTITTTEEICGFTPSQAVTFTAKSKVTTMMKLRPTIAIEGGSIGPLTISEGTYDAAPASTATTTDDVVGGAATDEQVLNGLYSQAPLIKIGGTGTGATATATLTDGKVSNIAVVGGSGYDKDNTSITVESSVQDANGNPTRAAFLAKFIPVAGATTIEGNAAARTTTINGGTFYTQAQFDAFNANNTSNNLVTLEARYILNGATSTIAASTQSNTALTATPAGTPLNPFYSVKTGTAATADTDKNDTDPVAGVGIATPGVNFSNGGQGYSEDSDITITAVDANNTRTANTGTPFPGDVNDQAQFDYSLAEGYVTEVSFISGATTVPDAASPLGIVLGQLPNGSYDLNGDGDTADAGETVATGNDTDVPEAGAGALFEQSAAGAAGIPNNPIDPTGVAGDGLENITYQQGQATISSSSGTGIQALRPVTGSNGGRFAQTPELAITGPGTGFEYRVEMAYEHAIQPVLESFVTNTYQFGIVNFDASALNAAPFNAGGTFTVTFADLQPTGGAGQPTTAATFTAQVVLAAASADLDNDTGADDRGFTIVNGTFAGSNSGGAGYNVVNINNMVLGVTQFANATGTIITPVPAGTARPQFLVNNNDATLVEDQTINQATFATSQVEGISTMTLGGRIVQIVADNGRTGSGYAAHPTNTYTINATGYSENVPTSAQIGAITNTPTVTGLQLAGGSGVAATVIATGDGFPYIKGVDNKNFIRLRRRDNGEFIPRAQIQEIKVARRIGYVAFKQYAGTVYQTSDWNFTTRQGVTALGVIGGIAPGTIGYTGGSAAPQSVAVALAGKTVAAVDADNDGTSDYWGFVGNGYATPAITLTIAARNFAGGAPDDAAVAEVRSSGLAVGSVTVNSGVVHPTVATRSNADPVLSVVAEPTFRFQFAAPAGTTNFGTPTSAGSNVAATYDYYSITEADNRNFMLDAVEVTGGGANYSAAPFFRVSPSSNSLVSSTAQGDAAVAGGAVTGVTVNSKGSYARKIGTPGTVATTFPNITLNDYLRKLYLREEGVGSARLKLNGVGTVSTILVDNAGAGYDAVGTNGSVVPNLMVVSKGNDHDDKNNDGIFQNGEHRGTQAVVTINAGANLAALTSADFTITTAGDGYTQDPDILVWTQNNEYVALPRTDDNPVIVEETSDAAGLANIRAFVVENNSATDFAEQTFTLTEDAGDADDDFEETEAWAGAANAGANPVSLAEVQAAITFDNASAAKTASARTNEGTISKITIGNVGDNLVAGTYPLVIRGGGSNVSTIATASVVIEDGKAKEITGLTGGAGYDDSALNPGPDGEFAAGSTFSNNTTAAVPAGGSDDFVGVKVEMLLGAGASAEAIPDAINVGTIEITDGGAGYNDEPFSVRLIPAQADRAAGNDADDYLADPIGVSPNVIEAKVSAVTVNATTGAIESITVDPNNPGYGYTVAPEVRIENFTDILKRESLAAYNDNANNAPKAAWGAGEFEDFVTAKVAVETSDAGAITKVDIINPGFGYIASPEIRVLGIGDGAVLAAGGINFLGGIDAQTGVADYQGLNLNYFLGSTMLPFIDFADHRLNSVTITNGGSGYLGGNFPRSAVGFSSTLGNMQVNTWNVPAGSSSVNDIYYGTGNVNASEVDDNGSNARKSAGDNQ